MYTLVIVIVNDCKAYLTEARPPGKGKPGPRRPFYTLRIRYIFRSVLLMEHQVDTKNGAQCCNCSCGCRLYNEGADIWYQGYIRAALDWVARLTLSQPAEEQCRENGELCCTTGDG